MSNSTTKPGADLMARVQTALAKHFAQKSEAQPGTVTLTDRELQALVAKAVAAGMAAANPRARKGAQAAMDLGAGSMGPGLGESSPTLGDRAAEAFRSSNAHRNRIAGLARAAHPTNPQGPGGDGRTAVQKAEIRRAGDALSRSSLMGISGAAIRKSEAERTAENRVLEVLKASGSTLDVAAIVGATGLDAQAVHGALGALATRGVIDLTHRR